MSPIIAHESVEIPAISRRGTIIKSLVEASVSKKGDGKSYNYLNMVIQVPDEGIKGWNNQFRVSISANLSKQTDLGRLLGRLELEVPAPKQTFDERQLEGMEVEFDTIRQGYFTNIVIDSITKASPVEE